MPRNPEYQFIPTDTTALVSSLISAYETIAASLGVKMVVKPASPERLFISWIADVLVQERALANYSANQNLPSRADGINLDALGEQLYNNVQRPVAQAAKTTVRFHITAVQASPVLVPSGTRVTDANQTLVWATTADAYITAGNTYVDVMVQCQTLGAIGNGYVAGQIKVLIDVDNIDYYSHCANTTTSDGGDDAATDDEYYDLMRASQDAYTTAGARGAYIYLVKQISTEIADVVANRPSDGHVNLYILMKDGTPAGTEIKNAAVAVCNPKDARPLTDYVAAADPVEVSYDIAFTYYIPTDSPKSAAEIEAAVDKAVADYVAWQAGKLGRDINPSKLGALLMTTGIKRFVLTSPVYTALSDGLDNTTPELAVIGTITATNGGYEDE